MNVCGLMMIALCIRKHFIEIELYSSSTNAKSKKELKNTDVIHSLDQAQYRLGTNTKVGRGFLRFVWLARRVRVCGCVAAVLPDRLLALRSRRLYAELGVLQRGHTKMPKALVGYGSSQRAIRHLWAKTVAQ